MNIKQFVERELEGLAKYLPKANEIPFVIDF
jgi:hypothetical protein